MGIDSQETRVFEPLFLWAEDILEFGRDIMDKEELRGTIYFKGLL